MACDLQYTYMQTQKFKGGPKIISLKPDIAKDMFGVNKAYLGFAGNADTWGEVVGWFSIPTEKMPRCKNIEFLLLTDTNQIYHATNLRNWFELKEPHFAIGSGSQFALSAMELGKTPKEAVKIAMKYDIGTGLGVKEYKL